MTKTWLITGCSTGLGSILAEAVLARGDNLVATARTASSLDSLAGRYPGTVRTTALDVAKPGDAAAAVALAKDAFGKLDILVNNAGHGDRLPRPLHQRCEAPAACLRRDGRQDGDPNKAVAVILKAVDADEPPLHLPLGERAYSVARTKLAAFKTVIDAWEADAIATGFPARTSSNPFNLASKRAKT